MKIQGFSSYRYCKKTDTVTNICTGKIVSVSNGSRGEYMKLKDDSGKWISKTKKSIVDIASDCLLSERWFKIPSYDKYYVDIDGNVLSTVVSKKGRLLSIFYPKDHRKYPSVRLGDKIAFIHQIVARTFIDSEYTEKGLCVIHVDNDKHNHRLENLKVGTYSENNKQAYDDGINTGRQ